MVKRLKRNLYILLIGSLMLVFSIVFCLLVQQNIKEKRENSIAYLNRMASMLIFSMEQNSDYRELLSVYEKNLATPSGFFLIQTHFYTKVRI